MLCILKSFKSHHRRVNSVRWENIGKREVVEPEGGILFKSRMKLHIQDHNTYKEEQDHLKWLIVKKYIIYFKIMFCTCEKLKFLLVKPESNLSVCICVCVVCACDSGKAYFNMTCQHLLIFTQVILILLSYVTSNLLDFILFGPQLTLYSLT